jgi:hypothetical protein
MAARARELSGQLLHLVFLQEVGLHLMLFSMWTKVFLATIAKKE